MDDEPRENLNRVVSAYVAGAVIAVGLVGGAIDGLVAAAVQGKLEAGAADYVKFGQLYLSTLLLSGTLTAAIAAYSVPTLDGPAPSYWLPIWILVGGAWLTGLPVAPAASGPAGYVLGAFNTFAAYYGPAFITGCIVGVAGGGIVYEVAKYSKNA